MGIAHEIMRVLRQNGTKEQYGIKGNGKPIPRTGECLGGIKINCIKPGYWYEIEQRLNGKIWIFISYINPMNGEKYTRGASETTLARLPRDLKHWWGLIREEP